MRVLGGIVLEVCVLNQAQFTARGVDRGANGGALSAVPGMADDAHDAGAGLRNLLRDFRRPIGRPVVDDHNLPLDARGKGRSQDTADQGSNEFLFVVKWNQDREKGHRLEE